MKKTLVKRVISLMLAAAILPCSALSAAAADTITVSTESDFVDHLASGFMTRQNKICLESSTLALDTDEIMALVNEAELLEIEGESSSGYYCMENVSSLNMSYFSDEDGTYYYTVEASYHESGKELKAVDKRVNKLVKNLKLNKGSDYDKVKKITRWMLQNLSYDYSLNANSAYKALKTGDATCMGYALLFQKLASEAGITCQTVRGYTENGYHICNAVKLRGKWYYIDICSIDTARDASYFLFGSNFCKSCMSIDDEYKLSRVSKKDYPASTSWLEDLLK